MSSNNGHRRWRAPFRSISPIEASEPRGSCRRTRRRPVAEQLEGRALLSVYSVSTFLDNNDGNIGAGKLSLREAVLLANSHPGPDQINLPAGTYQLTIAGTLEDQGATGDLDINDDLTIVGSGSSSTIIDGNQADRIFDVYGYYDGIQPRRNVTISGVTIRGGKTPDTRGYTGDGALTNSGGGIQCWYAALTINNCVVSGNETGAGLVNSQNAGGFGGYGGGIYANLNSTLAISNSSIVGNRTGSGASMGGFGGGIGTNQSTVTISGSTIANNTTGASSASGISAGRGGGISNQSGSLTINASSVTGNVSGTPASQGLGGGIYLTDTTGSSFTGMTLTGNTATIEGGGAWIDGSVTQILNSTIADNTASGFGGAGGIFNQGTIALISGTTISGNRALNVDSSIGGGGGVLNWGTLGSIVNSTFAGNSTNQAGGGPD